MGLLPDLVVRPTNEGMAHSQHSSEQQIEKLTYNAREACVALGISSTTLWRLERRGFLTPLPGLRHKLYPTAAVRRFAEKGAVS